MIVFSFSRYSVLRILVLFIRVLCYSVRFCFHLAHILGRFRKKHTNESKFFIIVAIFFIYFEYKVCSIINSKCKRCSLTDTRTKCATPHFMIIFRAGNSRVENKIIKTDYRMDYSLAFIIYIWSKIYLKQKSMFAPIPEHFYHFIDFMTGTATHIIFITWPLIYYFEQQAKSYLIRYFTYLISDMRIYRIAYTIFICYRGTCAEMSITLSISKILCVNCMCLSGK